MFHNLHDVIVYLMFHKPLNLVECLYLFGIFDTSNALGM